MSKPRYLTKSRYKMGIECPTKLFYTGKKEYANSKMDDPFLAALADGGHQVGELAKCYFPDGHDITTLDYEEAERQTSELLKQENVVIFEPAIRFKNLFIRVDVLVKKGSHFKLIEVKAKSFNSEEEDAFLNKNGTIKSTWKPYLYDIAFQKYVLASAFPDSTVTSYLMMADKLVPCPVEGLNQKFRIVRDDKNRKGISISNTLTQEDLKTKILVEVPVDEFVELIHERKDSKDKKEMSFVQEIDYLAEHYENDNKIDCKVGTQCQSCEYNCTSEDNLKSGFQECWAKMLGWTDKDFKDPNILEIWNYRGKKKLFEEGIVKLSDVTEEDISPKENTGKGISPSERQWLQVEKANTSDNTAFFDAYGMNEEMKKWKFPLHFIDFETTAVAIPFNKGRKPYEGIAFQFSHHIVKEDGTVEHFGEYINTNRGEFPNYDFVRELKKQLEQDQGTIFRYAPHENTFLNLIYRQLNEEDCEEKDKEELCNFIKTITKSVGSSVEKWEGERNMIDMWELVKKYYYHPMTKGSNSIKYVLPSIMNLSAYLQDKYSKPIYGANNGIKSLNFENWCWIQMDEGQTVDPYKLLPKMFQDISDKNMKILTEDDELKNGGAALTAYGKMQFSEITDYEKEELTNALLKYCELDTFAMVMIYEGWREMVVSELGEEAA